LQEINRIESEDIHLKKRFRRGLAILAAALMLLITLLPTTALAATDESYFSFNAATGTITGYNIAGGTDIDIPSTIGGVPVTAIGANAFEYMNTLNSVIIPEGVTSIGDYAFNGCEQMGSVTLPDSLESIGISSFSCCGFSSIALPAGLTGLGEGAFGGSFNLGGITIPAGITEIEDDVFSGCEGLGSVVFQGDITRIGNRAFRGCNLSYGITLPDSLESIGDEAFYNCTGLISINIPDSVTSIGADTFVTCTNLQNVTLPSGLTAISDSMFNDCRVLESITLPDSVTSIGSGAFALTALERITLPTGVTSIGERAFWGCNSLTEIEIPSGVISIGNVTFLGCVLLADITLPSGLTSIGEGAFYNCNSLHNLTMPNGVTDIGYGVFQESGLYSLTIPAGVTTLGGDLFTDCSGLTSVYFLGNAPSVGTSYFGFFGGIPAGLKVYYPYGASGWSDPWQGREAIGFYKLSFDANGGTGSPPDPMMAESGDMISIPNGDDYFTRTGYTFSGLWNTQADGGGTEYGVDWSYTFAAHVTLYAQWTPAPYTIGYDLDGGAASPVNPTSYTIESGAITLNNPTKSGYIFAGWSGTDISGTSMSVIIPHGSTGDRTYTAHWTAAPADTYTVTFDSRGGSAVAPQAGLTSGALATRPADPSLTGYIFGGWYKEAACVNVWDFAADRVTDNITLYAKWIENAPGDDNADPPTVRTDSASNITISGATLNGNVISDGGTAVTERGFVYGASANPAIGGAGVTKIASGSGTGSYAAPATGLEPDTAYYVRAYAINKEGVSYGASISFRTEEDDWDDIPKTGDSSSNLVWWLLSGASAAGIAVLAVWRKKRKFRRLP